MSATSHEFQLSLSGELFAQVKEHLAIGLSRPVDDKETTAFLEKHPALLGSIVQFDEVDTEDRSQIWEHCRSWRYNG